jgi:protein gp37
MGETTIEWTDAVWNPVTGCNKVSPGCSRCYAETIDHRFDHDNVGKLPWAFPASRGGRGVTLHPERLEQPLHWKKSRRVFVNSMSDLFHEDVPDVFIDQVFGIMDGCRRHTFQVLTKRPDRMLPYLTALNNQRIDRGAAAAQGLDFVHRLDPIYPLPNVWLGVSVENQLWAERRIPLLLQTPAAVRFLSCEPLLGPLDLTNALELSSTWGTRCNWVITGGESGPKARPMHPDWARSIRDQCQAAGVPFFYKQGNGPRPGQDTLLDGREWREFPS